MNDLSDQQLLREYAEHRSESAFTELVRRYVDLVHSAGFRMTGDAHSAQDVTQGVFVALAQNAARLAHHPVLSGWLHTTARNLAAKLVRAAVRRQNHEQEAAAMNELLSTAPDASWEEIAPHLDAALGELSEPERNVVLLRYFERKTAGEISILLDITEDAAQKRVRRAVDRLRGFFTKRGITVGAGGLVVVISANAVQAAPVGLAATISAAALAETAVTTSTIIATTTKTIAMTTLQKTLVATTVAVLAGVGIYEARQAAKFRDQAQTLRQQQGSNADQIEQLHEQRDDAAAQLTALRNENDRLKNSVAALRKSRTTDLVPASVGSQSPAASAGSIPKTESKLPKDSWSDAGFATPEDALKTRGWAVLNGSRERFKESLFITDGARKVLEDMFVKMAEASKDPNKAQYLQAILDNKLGVEDAILMPLMALNEQKGFAGYRILSQQSPSDNERILEVETEMTSASPQKDKLKLRRIGNDWKVVIDEDFVKSAH